MIEISKSVFAFISEFWAREITQGYVLGRSDTLDTAIPNDPKLLLLAKQQSEYTTFAYFASSHESVPLECTYFIQVDFDFGETPFRVYSCHSIDKEKLFIPCPFTLTTPNHDAESILVGQSTMKESLLEVLSMLKTIKEASKTQPEKWMYDLIFSLPAINELEDHIEPLFKLVELVNICKQQLEISVKLQKIAAQ